VDTARAQLGRGLLTNHDARWPLRGAWCGGSAELDSSGQFIYVTGKFTAAAGLDRNGLAAYSTSGAGAIVAAWDPGATGPGLTSISSAVGATQLRAIGDKLLVGGDFTKIGSTARAKLAGLPLASVSSSGPLISITPRLIDLGVLPFPAPMSGSFTIGNTGDAPLVIQSITGAANQTNDCGASLAPAATCTVQFTTLATGDTSTRIVVTSNGSGTPQSVRVQYTIAVARVILSDTETQEYHFSSAGSVPHMLTNTGNYPVSITGISIGQPANAFAESNDCPSSLAPSASCTITVTFTPGPPSAGALLNLAFGAQTNTPAGVGMSWGIPLFGTLDPAGDYDKDGIPNGVEITLGTNPAVKDNDVFSIARLFVMQQYRDFLNREGDAGGVDNWTNYLLGAPAARRQVVEFFFNSAEFQSTVSPVVRLYFAYFLRTPDYAGLQYWINQYKSGHTLLEISNSFAASPEFIGTYGSLDNAQFVNLVYQNVLGRAPDTTGFIFWTYQLDTGAVSRGQLMLNFSESAEYWARSYNMVYVTMMYVGMLRRAPDPAGFNFWMGYMNAGNPGQSLINGFLVSTEYHSRFLP